MEVYMLRDYKVVIGVAPTRRDFFPSPNEALENKKKIMQTLKKIFDRIHDVEVVNIDWLNDEGMLSDTADVVKVEKRFKEAGVDAVFVPHCNFGQEEVVAKLGKAMGKPFLLWGPRDEAPQEDGRRLHDTQCGLFASGKALSRYGVPFTYIENCWMDDPLLEKSIGDFVRVVSVVKEFKTLRIGQISLRPWQFHSVMINEDELLEKFGIEIVPINATEILQVYDNVNKDKQEEIKNLVGETAAAMDVSAMSAEEQGKLAALELSILDAARKYGCTAMASECWRVYRSNIGVGGCYVFGNLSEKGLPVACETDIHGAVTSAMLSAAARGETPVFLADVTVRHPSNDNAELLWHCGPFPKSLAKEPESRKLMRSQGHWELKGGDVTVLRFDAIGGNYTLFGGEAVGTDGPKTNGNYIWIETDDWAKWEKKLVCGPYIHHVAGIHGKLLPVMEEACKYIEGLSPDFV
jgi:L-fucose isomerase-like protein